MKSFSRHGVRIVLMPCKNEPGFIVASVYRATDTLQGVRKHRLLVDAQQDYLERVASLSAPNIHPIEPARTRRNIRHLIS